MIYVYLNNFIRIIIMSPAFKSEQITAAIGLKLKQHFEAEGISQFELAKENGTKQSWISRIYKGNFTSRSKVARALCEKANIPFIDDKGVETVINEEKKILKIANQIVHLSKNDKQTLHKMIKVLNLLE